MAQTLFNATGITADNTTALKDAGSAIAGVKWVNVMQDKIVVTHEDNFDDSAFVSAIKNADGNVSLDKA